MDERIAARRRRRRLAERRRRAAIRRRNFLLGAAGLSFLLGIAIGAGHADSTQAGQGSQQATVDAAPIPADVPTVDDFHKPVPILMYHAISPAPPDAALPNLFVPEAEFEAQMKLLHDQGYNGVTLGQVFAAWNDGEPIAKNPIVISFDDGLQSQYAGARPMLEHLGWPGVLNLAISHLESGDLTEDEVTDLIASGWELDSHTFSHVDLTQDGVDLTREIADSRTYLQDKVGVPVDFFCYPAGDYNDDVIAAVEDAGYLGATTTHDGLASPDHPYELHRIRVEPGDGADGLAAKLVAAAS